MKNLPLKQPEMQTQFEEHLRKGEFNEAEAVAEALVNLNPASPLPFSMKGALYETMGRLRESADNYQKAYELDPGNPEYLYWICEIYLMFYDIPNTLKYCKMGQECFPGDYHFLMVEADAWLWKISIDNLTGAEKEDALENSGKILSFCLSLNPHDGEVLAIEGTWFLQKGNTDLCLDRFKKALEYGLELHADYVDTGLVLAILHLQKGESEEAAEYIKKSLDYFNQWDEPHYLKLFLFYEHLLMLREVRFGKRITPVMIEPFRKECENLMAGGMKVHPVTVSLRNHILNFLDAREEKDYSKALQHLNDALEIFKGRLPLCIIFNTIKKPSLVEILTKFREDMIKCISDAC